jgi:nicotinamidase-related amidase
MTAKPTCDPARTGLLLVDAYNDFLSGSGKMWPRVKEVAEEVGLIDNMKAVVKTLKKKSIQVFIVPHHRSLRPSGRPSQRALGPANGTQISSRKPAMSSSRSTGPL